MTEYEVYSLAVNALAGLGTVFAVLTSLYLARKQNQPRVRVSVAFAYPVAESRDFCDNCYIQVSALNYGTMQERIGFYGYSAGYFRWKKNVVVKPMKNIMHKHSFPSVLEPGEYATDMVPLETFNKYQLPVFTDYFDSLPFPDILKGSNVFLYIVMRSAKCWVQVSRGEETSAYVGNGFSKFVVGSYVRSRE